MSLPQNKKSFQTKGEKGKEKGTEATAMVSPVGWDMRTPQH